VRLIVITQSYPYGNRSDFLEDEIGALGDAFDEVVVVPTSPDGTLQTLPDNVIVDRSLAGNLTRARRLRSFVSPFAVRVLAGEFRRRPAGHLRPRTLLRTVLAAGSAEATRSWLVRVGRHDDSIYTYWLTSASIGARAALPNVPIVSRVHRGDLFVEFSADSFIPLHERSIASCDWVASVSEFGAAYLRTRYPQQSQRIRVARLGTVRAPTANRSDDGTIRVVTCSSLTEVKRPLLLARSLISLARSATVEWHHFGDGPLRSVVESELAAVEGGTSLHASLHGNVQNDVVLDHFGAHPVDVFVNCSESEGVPVSIMEAMSSGIPVVATAVGGTPEIVTDSVGRLLPVDVSADRLAAAIEDVVAHPPTVEQVCEHWATEFDASKNYTEFALWLRGLVDEKVK
jgi:colanic acid/amylovoran biosynthesis glycosyltransferase